MLEVNELSYAAIITVKLPGMNHPATVTVALRPPDAIEVAPGKVKALRDCSLADLEAFAEALEAELWSQHQAALLRDIAVDEEARLKITVLNETGEPLALDEEAILEHAIVVQEAKPAAESEAEEASEPQKTGEAEPEQAQATTEDKPVAEDEAAATETESEPAVVEEQPPQESEVAAEAEPAVESDEEMPAAVEPPPESAPEPEPEQAEAPVPVETPVSDEAETEATAPAEAVPAPPPGRVRIAGLRRPVGHPTRAATDILFNEPAFRDAQAHALSSLDREVAGMLIGPRPEKQPDGRYVVHVTDIIIAKHTRMHGASVTYTPESWRYVSDRLNERYPDEEAGIVGWYHTHPGFGIFLSGMDLFIHQHFFTQKWHVALVLDPLAQKSGFFCWDREQTGVHPYEFPWPEWAARSW